MTFFVFFWLINHVCISLRKVCNILNFLSWKRCHSYCCNVILSLTVRFQKLIIKSINAYSIYFYKTNYIEVSTFKLKLISLGRQNMIVICSTSLQNFTIHYLCLQLLYKTRNNTKTLTNGLCFRITLYTVFKQTTKFIEQNGKQGTMYINNWFKTYNWFLRITKRIYDSLNKVCLTPFDQCKFVEFWMSSDNCQISDLSNIKRYFEK